LGDLPFVGFGVGNGLGLVPETAEFLMRTGFGLKPALIACWDVGLVVMGI
jgi:hypothetical protein